MPRSLLVKVEVCDNGYYMNLGEYQEAGMANRVELSRIAPTAASCAKQLTAMLTEMKLKDAHGKTNSGSN